MKVTILNVIISLEVTIGIAFLLCNCIQLPALVSQENKRDKDYTLIQNTFNATVTYLPKQNYHNQTEVRIVEPKDEATWNIYVSKGILPKDIGSTHIDGMTEYATNTIYLRCLDDKQFLQSVERHEIGHMFWNTLTNKQQQEYYTIWLTEGLKPGSEESNENEFEGFAEAFRLYTGPDSYQFHSISLNEITINYFKKLLVKPQYKNTFYGFTTLDIGKQVNIEIQ
jgi:hypothetical protein